MPGFATPIRFTEWRTAFELGLTKVHADTLKVQPKMYTDWLREEPAKRFYDKEWYTSGLGIMPEKGIGGTFTTDQIFQGNTKQYMMKTYGMALVIQYEVHRWDLYDIFPGVIQELAKSAVDRYNLVAYALLNNAFSTTDVTLQNWAGEAIISTSHLRLDGGTWSNRPASDIGLSYLALQQGVIDLRKQVNERGKFVQLKPRLLVTSVEQDWIARTILKSQFAPDTPNMNVNTMSSQGLSEIHSSPFITQANYFFIFCNKDDYKMKMSTGDAPDLVHDDDVRTRNRVSSSYCSFRLDVYHSHGVWGSSGGS